MDNEVAKVVNGWLSLSTDQRREFENFVAQYERSGTYSKESLRESVHSSVTKLQTGPLGGGCPCCGK